MTGPFLTYEFKTDVIGTPPSDTRVARDTPTRLIEVLNAKDFGAVGDGSTDDHDAIQALFDAAWDALSGPDGKRGRILYFPRGVYRVSHTIEMDYNHHLTGHAGLLEIEGAGRDVTVIVGDVPGLPILWTGVIETHIEDCPTPADEGPFISDSGLAISSNILVRDITIKNESTTTLSRAYWATNAGGVTYRNVKFVGIWGWGFHTNCFAPTFYDCIAECISTRAAGSIGFFAPAGDYQNCEAIGFDIGFMMIHVGGGMKGCRANNCRVGFSAGDFTPAISILGVGNVTLHGCTTDDCEYGFYLYSAAIGLASCITRNSTAYGIYTMRVSDSYIYGHISDGDAVSMEIQQWDEGLDFNNSIAAVPTSTLVLPVTRSGANGATINYYCFFDQSLPPSVEYSTLAAAANVNSRSTFEGRVVNITDGSPGSAAFGATITGGGSGHYKVRYDNSTNWIRIG